MTWKRRRALALFSPLPDSNKDLFCTCPAWLNLFPATLFVSLAKEGVPAVRYLLLLPDIFRSPKSHRPQPSKNISLLARKTKSSASHLTTLDLTVSERNASHRHGRPPPSRQFQLNRHLFNSLCNATAQRGGRGVTPKKDSATPPTSASVIEFLLVAHQTDTLELRTLRGSVSLPACLVASDERKKEASAGLRRALPFSAPHPQADPALPCLVRRPFRRRLPRPWLAHRHM
jgi:hypothetical protein